MVEDASSHASSRLYPALPLLAVSVCVFRGEAALLATRTRPPYAGAFSLPGGLVEAGETMAGAALRELSEEVGVEAAILGFNRHVESIERDEAGRVLRHFVIASFVADWRSGEGTPGIEAGAVVWARPEALDAMTCTPLTREVVRAASDLLPRLRAGRAVGRRAQSD